MVGSETSHDAWYDAPRRGPTTPFNPVVHVHTVTPLTKTEERRLEAFLSSPLRPEGTMTYPAFRGYLFGFSGGPAMVPPSVWMSDVFGGEDAGYADLEEANAVLGAVMSAYNHTNAAISGDIELTPEAVGLDPDSEEDRFEWSAGFCLGYDHVRDDWDRAMKKLDEEDQEALSAVFVTLMMWSEPETYLEDAQIADGSREEFLEQCRQAIPNALTHYASIGLGLFRAGLAAGKVPIRRAPQVGRNDPCPCGSGRKFKKCCLN